MWSQRPSLSYFSKGPGIAFTIRSSTAIFGANEFGVHFWPAARRRNKSASILLCAPFVWCHRGPVDSGRVQRHAYFQHRRIVMTIDALSIFFWMAAMFTFWLAVESPEAFRGTGQLQVC